MTYAEMFPDATVEQIMELVYLDELDLELKNKVKGAMK